MPVARCGQTDPDMCSLPALGRLQVSFKPEISATYGLAIALNGVPLQGCPFKVRIRNDETIAANCRLYGPGLTTGTAGVRAQFSIQGALWMRCADQ